MSSYRSIQPRLSVAESPSNRTTQVQLYPDIPTTHASLASLALQFYLTLCADTSPGLPARCKVAPESWVIGGSKVVSSKRLEGYEMFDPRDSRREDREEENA